MQQRSNNNTDNNTTQDNVYYNKVQQCYDNIGTCTAMLSKYV